MKLNIAHIVIDEKFMEGALSLFEADERVNNSYYIVNRKFDRKYLKKYKVCALSSEEGLRAINSSDAVIIHSLPAIPLDILPQINENVKVVWLAWGYDIYESPYDIIPVDLYGRETKKHTRYLRLSINLSWKRLAKVFKVKKLLPSVLKRIDYFSGVFPYEYDLIKKHHPYFKAEPVDFYYGSANDFFIKEEADSVINHGKKNIIIGNSANMTGNHFDVIEILSKVNIEDDSKLIIPLSYGNIRGYADAVEKEAEKIAPGRVVSLRNYMPFNEYYELISTCRTAIYAHERQQASDNIFLQMIFGARVYMSETSSAYNYLKGIGLKVYSLQSDLSLFNDAMKDEDVINNRRILSSLYAPSKLIERVKNINTILIDSLS